MKDAIIVLGRGISQDGALPPDPISRVEKAAELFREGVATRIIMTGGYSYKLDNTPQISEAEAMKTYAISLGVPEEVIIEESSSTHTIANAYFTKKLICEPNNWKDLVLVTSEEHMPRAEYVFKKMFGPEYTFESVISKRVLNDEDYAKELLHEKTSLETSKLYLEPVRDGDDETIKGLILGLNPNDTVANI